MKRIYCRYVIRMTQSYVWDYPCTCICHRYGLTRLYLFHYSVVIWAPSRLQSMATRLFVHVLLQLDIKGNPKAPITVRLLGVSTDDWWILATKGGDAETVSMPWLHYKNIKRHTAYTIVSTYISWKYVIRKNVLICWLFIHLNYRLVLRRVWQT